MKKVTALLVSSFLSTSALAEGISGEVGLGIQTSSVDSSYGECWSECYGDTEPTGFALEGKINFGPGLFATLDYAATKDEEDMYDDSITSEWNDTTIGFGYAHQLNSDSVVTIAANYSDIEWNYDWSFSGGWYRYDAEDSGVSIELGAQTKVNDKLEMGASISQGFATGVKAYSQLALSDKLALKVSYENMGYELGDFGYTAYYFSGVNSPSDADGDGDYEFDNQTFRLSAVYQF